MRPLQVAPPLAPVPNDAANTEGDAGQAETPKPCDGDGLPAEIGQHRTAARRSERSEVKRAEVDRREREPRGDGEGTERGQGQDQAEPVANGR